MTTYYGLLSKIMTEISQVLSSVDENKLGKIIDKILNSKRIFVLGVGRSGLVMKGFAMRLMHLGLNVFVVGESTTPAIGKGDLLIIGSGSGRTPSVVTNVKKAWEYGSAIISITSNKHSPIVEYSDFTIFLLAPTPKVKTGNFNFSIQPMGSLFEQSLLIFADLIVLMLMDKLCMTSDKMFKNHANLE